MSYTAHETSVIDEGAQVGDDSKIWHYTHICGGANIGDRVSIGQNVYVGNRTSIGNRCKIQNNVSIYDGVHLQEGVFCGPSMVFTNVSNPRALVEKKTEFRETIVKRGASLGANCTIICGITIGKYALIGAGAVVRKNVPDYALIVGVPGRQIGWVSEHGETLKLPLSGKAEATCPATGETYRLVDSKLEKVS